MEQGETKSRIFILVTRDMVLDLRIQRQGLCGTSVGVGAFGDMATILVSQFFSPLCIRIIGFSIL